MNPVFRTFSFQCLTDVPEQRMADVPGDTSPRQGFPGFHWTGLAFIMKLDPVDFDGEGVVALHTDSGLLLQLLMLCRCF